MAHIDTVIGGIFLGLAALFTVGAVAGDDPASRKTSAQAIPGSLLLTAPFAASAVYGHYKANECTRAFADWEVVREERTKAEQRRVAAINRIEAERMAAEDEARRQAEERRRAAVAERLARISELKGVPQRQSDLRIANAYAESLFRIDVVLPETEELFSVADVVRLGALETTTFPGGLVWRPGQRVVIRVRAKSLGEWREFDDIDIESRAGETLTVTYDWDTADAAFRVRARWDR